MEMPCPGLAGNDSLWLAKQAADANRQTAANKKITPNAVSRSSLQAPACKLNPPTTNPVRVAN